jgi:hypothetical protein
MKTPLERPQVEPPCRPSGIHSREGGRLMRCSTEDAEFRHGDVRACRGAMPR